MTGKPVDNHEAFYALRVEGATFEGELECPASRGRRRSPSDSSCSLQAMSVTGDDFGCHVMFHEDDLCFVRIWSQPNRYRGKLQKFAGAISPDISTCTDFPWTLKVWYTYRDRAAGFWMQHHLGIEVIPNVQMEQLTKSWSLDGLPHDSLIAVGARAYAKNRINRQLFCDGLKLAVDELNPIGIVWYGADAYGCSDYPRSTYRSTYSKDAGRLRVASTSKEPSGIFDGTRGNGQGKLELGSGSNSSPPNRSQISHIFGNREGHLPDMPANRRLIGDLVNDSSCLLGLDMWGKEWYARTNSGGAQVWATVLNGIIQNCGENVEPRPWNPETGLSDSEHKHNGFRRR